MIASVAYASVTYITATKQNLAPAYKNIISNNKTR